MERQRITSKLARLTGEHERATSNRDYALRCARESMAGDPAGINGAVVGNVVAALSKAATLNATIERLNLEILFLNELME